MGRVHGIKKKEKMKVATAAFLVLCTLVAIGLVSSAKFNDRPREARGGVPMPELCSGCYCDHYYNTHCYNGECWNNGKSFGRYMTEIAIQRGNALCVMGTTGSMGKLEELNTL